MYWDRFDICEAYYRFAVDFHGGINCPIYQYFGRLSRMEFRPSASVRGDMRGDCRRLLNDNGKEIYDNLLRRWWSTVHPTDTPCPDYFEEMED
jgi:hypothetical protein